MIKRAITIFVSVCVAIFVLIQFVPYGRNHVNPPDTKQLVWKDPASENTFRTICMQCHSNHTEWPWYTNIAPGSWLVQSDVDNARLAMNLSETDVSEYKAGNLARQVQADRMPPFQYKLLHWDAIFSDAQKKQLIDGINKTFPQ